MNQIQRGRDMAKSIDERAARADQIILAKYSDADYPSVLAAGFATVSFEQYNQRLAGVVATFEQQGTTVIVVPVTAEQLQQTLSAGGTACFKLCA